MDAHEERLLIGLARDGDSEALENLIRSHQSWVYNIVLRMTGNRTEAEDITQEILVKAVTGLSGFKGQSRFRTWLYRIAANHLLSMKKKGMEHMFRSFENHESIHSRLGESDYPDERTPSIEQYALINETKALCLAGMLLCLDRQQRLVFILGAIYAIDSRQGGKILELSPENFRKILSRGRRQLKEYMQGRCGLIKKENPCRCARKTEAMIAMGYVNPEHMSFNPDQVDKIGKVVERKLEKIGPSGENLYDGLFLEQPFVCGPDYAKYFKDFFTRSSGTPISSP